MVDHTLVGHPTGIGQPPHGREYPVGAIVGRPTGTENDYETVTDPGEGVLHDGDQIIINFPLVGFQTKKQTALEAFAATMTVDLEVHAVRRRVNFTQWDNVIAVVLFRKKHFGTEVFQETKVLHRKDWDDKHRSMEDFPRTTIFILSDEKVEDCKDESSIWQSTGKGIILPDEGSVNSRGCKVINTQPDKVDAATQKDPEEEIIETTIDTSKVVTVSTQVDDVMSPTVISRYVQTDVMSALSNVSIATQIDCSHLIAKKSQQVQTDTVSALSSMTVDVQAGRSEGANTVLDSALIRENIGNRKENRLIHFEHMPDDFNPERPRRGRSPKRIIRCTSDDSITDLSMDSNQYDYKEEAQLQLVLSYLQPHQDRVEDIAQFIGYAYDKEGNDLCSRSEANQMAKEKLNNGAFITTQEMIQILNTWKFKENTGRKR